MYWLWLFAAYGANVQTILHLPQQLDGKQRVTAGVLEQGLTERIGQPVGPAVQVIKHKLAVLGFVQAAQGAGGWDSFIDEVFREIQDGQGLGAGQARGTQGVGTQGQRSLRRRRPARSARSSTTPVTP